MYRPRWPTTGNYGCRVCPIFFTASRWPGSWPNFGWTITPWPLVCCMMLSKIPIGLSIELQDQFGAEVARLVDGVTKLARIDTMSKMSSRDVEAQEAESLRKMFLAMTDDVRVVLIKLADRLHNMRTLDSLPPDRQERIARETLEIFAPLANRLGIWQMKWELEEWGFRYFDPKAYHRSPTCSPKGETSWRATWPK